MANGELQTGEVEVGVDAEGELVEKSLAAPDGALDQGLVDVAAAVQQAVPKPEKIPEITFTNKEWEDGRFSFKANTGIF